MGNRECTQIGIGAGHSLLRKAVTGKHVARIHKIRQPVHQAVALNGSYLQWQAQFGNFAAQRLCQPTRVHGTRIADNLRARLRDLRQKRADMHIHEITGETAVGIG